jgi:D-alanyl-D-alanine carboxypeptidase/D-alanyl-D-alanine-endopeptidase (penicillin-binding protein 4)
MNSFSMREYLKLFLLVSIFGFGAALPAQKPVQKFAESDQLKGSLVSVCIRNMETGETLEAANPDTRLCPASVWKIITTTAALKTLGPDFKFRTVLGHSGKIENGIF